MERRQSHHGDNDRQTGVGPCVGCGLCCDGTLYDMARAQPIEEAKISDAGLSLRDEGGKRYFSLPCRYSVAGSCSIYADRFSKCRSFRCKLLRDFQDGKSGEQAALDKVRAALELRSAVEFEEPAAVELAERDRIRRDPAALKDRPRLALKMMALDFYLDRHFRNKNPQVAIESDASARNYESARRVATIRS